MSDDRSEPTNRFPKKMRMKSSRDFELAYRSGARARGDVLRVVVAPNGLEYSRLGLSVGRSTWKRAVQRNRVRRIFREAFRLSARELPGGYDVILIPAVSRLEPKLDQTRAELTRLVAKARRRLDEREAGS